jgi:hypothetical protein
MKMEATVFPETLVTTYLIRTLCQKINRSTESKERPIKMGGRTVSSKRIPFQIGTNE